MVASDAPVDAGERWARYLIAAGWLSGIVGVIMFFLVMSYDPDAAPKCGNEVMSRGDRCFLNGVDHGGYDKQKEEAADVHSLQTGLRNAAVVVTPVLVGAGIIVRRVSRRRSGAA